MFHGPLRTETVVTILGPNRSHSLISLMTTSYTMARVSCFIRKLLTKSSTVQVEIFLVTALSIQLVEVSPMKFDISMAGNRQVHSRKVAVNADRFQLSWKVLR